MKAATVAPNRISGRFSTLFLAFSLLALTSPYAWSAGDASIGEKAQDVVRETSSAVSDAGRSAADSARQLWEQLDAARFKNRTPDQIAAWLLVGLLVGSAAGMMTTLKPTGMGKLGRLVLGLAGAFLGGLVVQMGKFDFGWGPVLIRYEELFFSLLGAVVIIVIGRLFRSSSRKKKTAS